MEILEFLKTSKNYGSGNGYGNGNGNGDGDGYGSGNGDGYGYSSGNGYGNGHGDGYGNGNGNGNGYGYGSGNGSGNGYGNGYGYGYGDGDGYRIKKINSQNVYLIDGIESILIKIKNNVAKGFILNKDLTLTPCYVAKKDNLFAHGKNLKDAQKALLDKFFENLSEDERIDTFLDNFKLDKSYPVMEFYDWHNKLTGSCELGRQTFCKNHNINLKNDKLTVDEFIDLCINEYGSEVMQLLKNKIEEF